MPVRLPSVTSIVLLPAPGSFDAATAITCRPAAGEPSVPSFGPELPAAATTEQPSKVALSEATAVASSGPPPPPRLMLITSATGLGWRSTVVGDTASGIAAKHRMRPIDASIDHRDDNILTLISVRRPWRRRRNSKVVPVISVESWRVYVRDALVEVRVKNLIRMNLLHSRHVCDCRHG